jgi:nucleoside-diphosphate-sugar epimerase
MCTVLVTGARGFIGGHLVKRLLGCGMRVRCLSREKSGGGAPGGAEAVQGDYVSGAGLREAVEGADIVFHLAGVTKALRRGDYWAGNVHAAESLARVADSVPRFVHISSLAAIGPSCGDEDVTETTKPHPVSEYGRSKLAGEQSVRRLLPAAVVVRPPVVYGPRDTDVFEMLRSINRGIELRIGRGERWFSAIYVDDLVEGLIATARSADAAGKTYFLTHPDAVSWSCFAATAAKLLHRRPRTVTLPVAAAYAAGCLAEAWSRTSRKPGILSRDKVREAAYSRWTCSAELARRELEFTAAVPLEEGMARAIAWYKQQGWL